MGAFASLYFTGVALGESRNREEFLDDELDRLGRVMAARAYYRRGPGSGVASAGGLRARRAGGRGRVVDRPIGRRTRVRLHAQRHGPASRPKRSVRPRRGSSWQPRSMARSFYKGERLGGLPACAICGGAGRGDRAELHLPAGVRVWLCAAHRSEEFLTRRAGRDLVASLLHVWRAAGCLTGARSRALAIHSSRLTSSMPARSCPGSYSWAALRREAEDCFASGESPGEVIRRLRSREMGGPARPPSPATMRRWFREGRWLAGPPGSASRPDPGRGRRGAWPVRRTACASRRLLPAGGGQLGAGTPGRGLVTRPSATYHSTVRLSESSIGV